MMLRQLFPMMGLIPKRGRRMAEYIDRKAAREVVCEMCRWNGTSNCEECEHPIDDIPAADVVKRKQKGQKV